MPIRFPPAFAAAAALALAVVGAANQALAASTQTQTFSGGSFPFVITGSTPASVTGSPITHDFLFGGFNPSVGQLNSVTVELSSSASLQGDLYAVGGQAFPASATNTLSFSFTAPGVSAPLSPVTQTLTLQSQAQGLIDTVTSGAPSVSATLTGSDVANYYGGHIPISLSALANAHVTTAGTDFEDDVSALWSGSVSVSYDYTLYAQPTFGSPTSLITSATVDFGTVGLDRPAPDLFTSVFNRVSGDPNADGRFAMSVLAVLPQRSGAPFSVSPIQLGPVPAGDGEDFRVRFDTRRAGDFTDHYRLAFGSAAATQDPIFLYDLTVHGAVAAPEPASWALLILGFGAMGAALRRRRAPAAA